MYCVVIKRDAENSFYNRAQYRVVMCSHGKLPRGRKLLRMGSVFAVQTDQYHQPNSFISPRKTLGV